MTYDPNYIGTAVHEGKPTPFSNWFYRWPIYHHASGTTTGASHASTIRTAEQWADHAEKKKGKPVGFGKQAQEVVMRVEIGVFEFVPTGKTFRLRLDAEALLVKSIREHMGATYHSRHFRYSHNQMDAFNWLRQNAGRTFEEVENPPQWTRNQFVSTMPTDDSEGGFAIPNGLMEVAE